MHGPPRPAASSPAHLPALDGLRGVAILAVLAFHLAAFAPPMGGAGGAALGLAHFGWAGVDLFFVLSGYLITGILYDNRGAASYFRAFYLRRALRIFPLYYGALALIAAGVLLFSPAEERRVFGEALPSLLLYFANVRVWWSGAWTAMPRVTEHFWSLMVEEQFYLLWPAAVALVATRGRLMVLCAALVVLGLACRLWLLALSPAGVNTLLPARMDSLAVGALVAVSVRGPGGLAHAVRWSGPVLFSCGLGILAVGAATAGRDSYAAMLQHTAGLSLFALFFGALLVRVLATDPRALRWGPLAATGRISYGLYVIHYPVILLCERGGLPARGFPVFAAVALAGSFALAVLSWRYFEAPILRLKDRFPYGARHPSPAPARVAAAA